MRTKTAERGGFLRRCVKLSIAALAAVLLLCFCISGAWLLRHYADARAQRQLHEALRELPADEPLGRLAGLREQYPAAGAWLSVPGVEEPVCLPDDNDFYISHDVTGRENRYGALFLDSEQTLRSANMTIYGHYGRQGEMFGALAAYRDPAFLAEHQSFTLETPAGETEWRIVAVLLTPGGGKDFWEWREQASASPARIEAFAAEARARALCATQEPVRPGDRLLSLVTCAYDYPNARLVVLAVG